MDLYKLIAKDSMQELGTMIFYTTESGKRYTVLQPGFTTTGPVWEKYSEDIYAIDKVEKNFVLTLSYVLSKEMSFQLYKAINEDKSVADDDTYGTDICFPGSSLVAMANGTKKALHSIKAGDAVITIDPTTQQPTIVQVKELVQHKAKNYAVTRLLLLSAEEKLTTNGKEILLTAKALEATPNHPLLTTSTKKKAGEIVIGNSLICRDKKSGGRQKVYNMVVSGGSTFVMNDVMVLQK